MGDFGLFVMVFSMLASLAHQIVLIKENRRLRGELKRAMDVAERALALTKDGQ